MRSLLAFAILTAAACAQAGSAAAERAGLVLVDDRSEADRAEPLEIRFSQSGGTDRRTTELHRIVPERPRFDYPLRPGRLLTVEARLGPKDRTNAVTTLRIDVDPDQIVYVHAAVRPDDPTAQCMGCMETRSTPIPGRSDGSRLWLWWSFNGISGPILF